MPTGRKLWAGLALLGAAVAATLVVVLVPGLLPRQGTEPQASANASASQVAVRSGDPSTSPSSSAGPTASTATPISADLQWTETGSFGSGNAFAFASAVVRSASGFVAVGTNYVQQLDPSGPLPPHEGSIWLSSDGRSWTDVTPPDTLADAVMEHVFTTVDGALIAIGRISNPDYTADEFVEPLAAWESADGRSWHRVVTGLPADLMVQRLDHADRGYLAALWNYSGGESGLWFSTDGRSWEHTYTESADDRLDDLGAGREGFVAIGQRGADDFSTFVIASSDGREWVESSSPPTDAFRVAPLGPDWIAIGPGPYSDYETDVETPVWFSANGLDWTENGNVLLQAVQLDGGGACREFVSDLSGAGAWLMVSTAFSYPCSEGGVQAYGRQLISINATTWETLPFTGFSYTYPHDREDGSIVLDGSATDRGLVLVGQSNGRASFWYGEPR